MKLIAKLLIAGIIVLSLLYLPRLLIHKQPFLGLHYASNSTTDFYDQAYEGIQVQKPTEPIAGITVNHHLLAPNLIAKEFALVATDKATTVVLISPNHFFRGSGGAIASKYDWQTPYGILKTNQDLVDKLANTGLLNVDETPFEQEHGINNIVGFIKKSLPNATFIPLIIKDNLSDENVDKLAVVLPKDVLIVGSLDFSHYLTSNAAQFHDLQTLSVIHNFDYDRIKKLDIDSHSGLRLIIKYFELKGAKKFVLTSHENSSTVTGNYNFVETTSYINGYFTSGQNEHDNLRTALYVQGLSKDDYWKPDASERLYKYNDEVLTQKPTELYSVNLGIGPIAVGLVYNPSLTDVYLFPLNISNHLITLLPQPEPGIMHIQIKPALPAGR